MASQGRNEGFHVLDEFVCKAIHAPSTPLASPTNQGRNEGMSVVEELVFEAGPESPSNETDDPDGPRPSLSPEQAAALGSVIESVAKYIAASSNPQVALAHFLKSLLAELTGIDRAAAEWLGRLSHANRPAEPLS